MHLTDRISDFTPAHQLPSCHLIQVPWMKLIFGGCEYLARHRRRSGSVSPVRDSEIKQYTVRPKSSDPFYIVSYYIKWVTTSWTHSTLYLIIDKYIY